MKIRDGSLNNLDKSIYSLVDRETTKHAKGAKLKPGKIVFKEHCTNGSSINPFRVFRVFRSSSKLKSEKLTRRMHAPCATGHGVILNSLIFPWR